MGEGERGGETQSLTRASRADCRVGALFVRMSLASRIEHQEALNFT